MPASDYILDILEGIKKEEERLVRPTILVAGYTGVGKTSLIQAICGKGIVPDDKIAHFAPGTQDFEEYENSRVRFWDSKGLEHENPTGFIKRTKEFVASVRKKPNVDEHIHMVWYCIGGPITSVTDADVEIMNSSFEKENMLVLITKGDLTREQQFKGMKQEIINRTGIRSNRILKVADEDKESLRAVMNATYELLPGAYKEAWIAAQIVDIEYKKSKAHGIIHTASAAAGGVGAIPIPASDAPLLSGIQIGMIGGLAVLYGVEKKATMSAMGPALASALGVATASSLVKIFPLIGSVIQASVAVAITETLGWTTQMYLEKCAIAKLEGRSLPQINIDEEKIAQMAREFTAKQKQLSTGSKTTDK